MSVAPATATATATAVEPSTRPAGSAPSRGSARRVLWAIGLPVRAALLGLIRLYQVTLSGLFGGQCRFDPTCSVYAAQAIRARGAVVGGGLAMWRIARCNPFGRGGSDPAPHPHGYEPVIRERAA